MTETVNLVEGILWIAIGFCFAISLIRPGWRRAKLLATFNFLVFGLSDFVEVHSGAWWSPWWLPFWKGACVCTMFVQIVHYYRTKRADQRQRGSGAT